MVSPVRYVKLIRQLVERGVSALVEVGPHQVLTGLHQQILSGQNLLTIASDDKTRGGLGRLLTVKANLEVRGLLDLPGEYAETKKAIEPSLAPPAKNGHFASMPKGSATSDRGTSPPVFSGSPFEIGQQQGRIMAGEIQRIAR